MAARRRPTLLRSVRFRIAAWTSLAVGIVALAAIFGLRQSIHWTLLREFDQVLVEDASEVQLVINELGPTGIDAVAAELGRKASGHIQHRWFVRLFRDDGRLAWESELAEEALPTPLAASSPLPSTIGEFRVLRSPASANSLAVDSYQLGASLVPLRNDMSRIDRIVAVASVLMILLAPTSGYLLAGLVTRELSEMTTRAARLRPSQLEDRLHETGANDEFDLLAQTINRLLDRIAEFIREKRTFLADAAHDLRTPIAAIRSSIEVALSAERSAEEYRELLEQLIEDSESLEVLVNQILLLSEAVAAKDTPAQERIDLSEVSQKAVEMFQGVAEINDVTLSSTVLPEVRVRGQRRHLSQLVSNLLDNAIKYTPAGGKVELTLTGAPSTDALLTVSDSGIGIAEEDVPRVFDRFFRADRARRRDGTRGAGLGLSICKNIVEGSGGRIVCRSRLGEGTRFVVSLPLAGDGADRQNLHDEATPA